jgi:transposase-like protein
MKLCKECNKEKSLSEFYAHKEMSDGVLNKCKDCVKARVHKHRDKNIEKIREYDKSRMNRPERVKARKDYIKTEAGKKAKQKAQVNYKNKYPLKYAAHVVTRNAIRDGNLKKMFACSVCSSQEKVEAHHDDYTKPLDVRWLCEKCHKEWHRNNKPIYE